ncbi:uncharacterized protein LOC141588814 [Silene latifolia]|uniref:uncharacterized protein LOC141588814 n=1 Tax=Silene latifolia TaxID=37657 RepID=UPI003D7713F5
MLNLLIETLEVQGQYTVASGYDWLQGAQGRLFTKDMMLRFGVISDGLYEICRTQLEDHQHLFFLCEFSTRCWTLLRDCIGVDLPATDTLNWCIKWRCKSLLKKYIVYAAVVALIYHIWMARNICREENRVPAPCYIVNEVKSYIQNLYRSREWSSRYKHVVN